MTFDTRDPDQGSALTEGWQADPAVAGQERWFDGARWTNMTRPAGSTPSPITEVPVRRAETFSGTPLTTFPIAPTAPPVPPSTWRPVGDVFGTPAAQPSRGGVRMLSVFVVILLVAAAAGVYYARRDTGPSHPKEWDPRVASIATFVEAQRGARFEQPIYVDFLSVAEFKKEVNISDDVTDDDREGLEQAAGALRAVGLLSGKVNLEAMFNQAQEEGIIGFYRPSEERITIRGEELTPAVKVTIAHELTHALQDQLYDIREFEDQAPSSTVTRALIEADAERIEDAYIETLSESEKAEYDKAKDQEGDDANFEGIPEVLLHSLFFPYTFGPPFLDVVLADGGATAIDGVFADPPKSEADLLSPFRYLQKIPLDKPAKPALLEGHEEILEGDNPDDDEFGQTTLVELLSARVGFTTAWKAVEGWRGDRSVASTDPSGKVCVAVNVRFDSDSSARTFNDAANAWAGVVKGSVAQTGADVLMRACDPGADAPALPAPVDGGKAYDLMTLRSLMVVQFVESPELNTAQAACVVDKLIVYVGPETFGELFEMAEGDPRTRQVQEASFRAGRECATGA
jgi:Protein of unknown function (DUF2510)